LSHELRFRPEALEDLRGAYLWYESKRPGLGEDFGLCVEAALALVRENPFLGRPQHGNARRVLVRRFPYAIFYEVEHRRVVVFAVFHGHRDPADWARRLE
jgi:plasmid stabilization system protein ParE